MCTHAVPLHLLPGDPATRPACSWATPGLFAAPNPGDPGRLERALPRLGRGGAARRASRWGPLQTARRPGRGAGTAARGRGRAVNHPLKTKGQPHTSGGGGGFLARTSGRPGPAHQTPATWPPPERRRPGCSRERRAPTAAAPPPPPGKDAQPRAAPFIARTAACEGQTAPPASRAAAPSTGPSWSCWRRN